MAELPWKSSTMQMFAPPVRRPLPGPQKSRWSHDVDLCVDCLCLWAAIGRGGRESGACQRAC